MAHSASPSAPASAIGTPVPLTQAQAQRRAARAQRTHAPTGWASVVYRTALAILAADPAHLQRVAAQHSATAQALRDQLDELTRLERALTQQLAETRSAHSVLTWAVGVAA